MKALYSVKRPQQSSNIYRDAYADQIDAVIKQREELNNSGKDVFAAEDYLDFAAAEDSAVAKQASVSGPEKAIWTRRTPISEAQQIVNYLRQNIMQAA